MSDSSLLGRLNLTELLATLDYDELLSDTKWNGIQDDDALGERLGGRGGEVLGALLGSALGALLGERVVEDALGRFLGGDDDE
ncbi:hypothetical protein AUR64_04840 [Haloprofundus marisrubri]|uniref:Uncharacterized protein n=1 Tax=Haloprofundus marisrubri TaxID=1514971 RepID=A0A0W1RDQ1_9EURY|nr:hypothetical protein [Haloprofundus marisrubri]KTG11255.1 hypothetical protein AUR64_04840 [Haloprofundus marisrubri]